MKELKRSKRDRMVSGVLGGVAQYFSISATLVRLIFVAVCLLTQVFPLLLLYVVAMFIMPKGSEMEE
ncbi:membrane protein [Pontibacillus halophilus JSM 076056 = DSM 19796]|uniref:Membrane protein n=1 Tax=Pontibacillus halophilus JSM 076056 = DSM 19796 TaxID=1385510 RepID=A0A0A5GI58_9BACI|nr:PspC domain-containing protein [Pontibacillus halophilus]KGX92926.1 membrane protein [Pontibacillus halophilus JSM 076056 = DSM 19796]